MHFMNGYIYPADSLSITFPELLKRPQARAKSLKGNLSHLAIKQNQPIVEKHIANIEKVPASSICRRLNDARHCSTC